MPFYKWKPNKLPYGTNPLPGLVLRGASCNQWVLLVIRSPGQPRQCGRTALFLIGGRCKHCIEYSSAVLVTCRGGGARVQIFGSDNGLVIHVYRALPDSLITAIHIPADLPLLIYLPIIIYFHTSVTLRVRPSVCQDDPQKTLKIGAWEWRLGRWWDDAWGSGHGRGTLGP